MHYLTKICFIVIAGVVSNLYASEAFANPCEFPTDGFYKFADNGPGKRVRGYVIYEVQLRENCTGVVTIQSGQKGVDWDVIVGSSFDPETRSMHGSLRHNNSDGVADEVVVLPSGKLWYIVVYPTTDVPSTGCIYIHAFDNSSLIADAFLWATAQFFLAELFGGENATENRQRNASRAASVGISALRGRNIGEMSYDLALSEVSSELAENFGAGSWLFSFGVNYAGNYLTEVGRFSLLRSQKCQPF